MLFAGLKSRVSNATRKKDGVRVMLRSLGAKPDGVQTCNRIWRIGISRSPNREVPGRRGDQRPRGGAPPGARIPSQRVRARRSNRAGQRRRMGQIDGWPGFEEIHVGHQYRRARGIGEVLVKEAFSGVTILRPCVIFGPDDSFFNALAGIARRSPVLPLFGMGRTNLQPVYVGDVAEACVSVLADPSTEGRAYELGGPRVYTYEALLRLVLKQVDRRRVLVPVPFFLWDTLAVLMAFLPNPPLTRDQVKLLKRDNVVEGSSLTLEDLGIGPIPAEEILPTYINANHRNFAF